MTSPTEPAEWWKRLDDQLASRQERTRRSIAINYPIDLYPHVLEAARARGMSMTGYQRRAALSFAQFDTGFNWPSEMRLEPPITPFDGGQPVATEGGGFGFWRILDLGRFSDG